MDDPITPDNELDNALMIFFCPPQRAFACRELIRQHGKSPDSLILRFRFFRGVLIDGRTLKGRRHPHLQSPLRPSCLRLAVARPLRLGRDPARCHCRSKTKVKCAGRGCLHWARLAAIAFSVAPAVAELAGETPA